MERQYIRQRQRILTPELKVKLCEMVATSSTVVEAAERLGVSLRTVQRERKYDEDFDHQLLLALGAPPDPLKLMQAAARTHWRAAAWLLERTRPEQYARRPSNMTHAANVNRALHAVLESILEITDPERRSEVFRHVNQAVERSLDCCFPTLGPWGKIRDPKLPETPLTNRERVKAAPVIASDSIGTPDDWPMLQPRCHAPRGNETPDAPRHETNDPVTPQSPESEVPQAVSQDALLTPGPSNQGQTAPPPTEVELAKRQEAFIDESLQLWQNAKRQRDRDRLDLLLSRKTKKATPDAEQQSDRGRAA